MQTWILQNPQEFLILFSDEFKLAVSTKRVADTGFFVHFFVFMASETSTPGTAPLLADKRVLELGGFMQLFKGVILSVASEIEAVDKTLGIVTKVPFVPRCKIDRTNSLSKTPWIVILSSGSVFSIEHINFLAKLCYYYSGRF